MFFCWGPNSSLEKGLSFLKDNPPAMMVLGGPVIICTSELGQETLSNDALPVFWNDSVDLLPAFDMRVKGQSAHSLSKSQYNCKKSKLMFLLLSQLSQLVSSLLHGASVASDLRLRRSIFLAGQLGMSNATRADPCGWLLWGSTRRFVPKPWAVNFLYGNRRKWLHNIPGS